MNWRTRADIADDEGRGVDFFTGASAMMLLLFSRQCCSNINAATAPVVRAWVCTIGDGLVAMLWMKWWVGWIDGWDEMRILTLRVAPFNNYGKGSTLIKNRL